MSEIRIRRAEPGDVDFLVELTNHEDVEPFMSARRPRDRDALLEEIEHSQAEPQEFGRFVIEVDGRLAGAMGFRHRERAQPDRAPRRAGGASGLPRRPDLGRGRPPGSSGT